MPHIGNERAAGLRMKSARESGMKQDPAFPAHEIDAPTVAEYYVMMHGCPCLVASGVQKAVVVGCSSALKCGGPWGGSFPGINKKPQIGFKTATTDYKKVGKVFV